MATFSIVHDLLSGIENAPSGSAAFYLPNTLTPLVVYGDANGTATTNPVTLDSVGRATVYLSQLARMIVQTTGGVVVVDTVINAQGDSSVVNTSAAFTGATSKAAMDTALTAFGGQDFKYVPALGAGGMLPKTWMTGVWRNVLAYASTTAPTVNDGVTPADTAIAAAVADVVAAGGGVVYFPPGTYLVSSAISVTSKNGVSFKGAGQGISVIKNTGAATNVFTLTSCASFFIEDIGISHSSSSTGSAVSLVSCSQFRVSSLAVTSHQFGVDISGAVVVGSEIRSPNIITTTNANSRAIRYNVSGNSANHVIYGGMLSTGGSGTGIEFNGSITSVSVLGVEFPVSGSFTGAGCTTGILFNASLTGNLFSVVGCMGLGSNGGFSIGVASDPVLFQFNNGVDGYSVDVASGGTVTPDRSRGKEIRIRATTTGVAYTINAPTPVPQARDVYLTLHFFNSTGGAVTGWTLNGTYHTTGAISTTDTNHTMLLLKWDNDSGVWRETSRAVTT